MIDPHSLGTFPETDERIEKDMNNISIIKKEEGMILDISK
jgi:hypothetical protein